MARVEGGSLLVEEEEPEKKRPGKGSLFEEEPKPQEVEDFDEGDIDDIKTKAKCLEYRMSDSRIPDLWNFRGDRSPSAIDKILEKKRPGKGSLFEEPKRLKVEDEDRDFYEADSDDENKDDDFTSRFEVVEEASWDDRATLYLDEEERGRRCHKVPVCHIDQHVSEFKGLPLCELFKIRVRLNHKHPHESLPLKGRLYGAIVTEPFESEDENPDPIFYYSVSKQESDSITLDSVNNTILLPLSTPKPKPPICYYSSVNFNFAFKLEDMVLFDHGYPYVNPLLFVDDGGCGNYAVPAASMYLPPVESEIHPDSGPFISREVVGEPELDPILMAAYFSFYRGAWATVNVKFLKKSFSSFYGFIYARPCIFSRRIRLLSVQPDQKGELEQESECVKLTRSVVAVPSNSSLIIAAVLYDQGGKRIVRGKTFFPASKKGYQSKTIRYEGVDRLKVAVEWTCKR